MVASTDSKPETLVAEIEEQLHDSGIGAVQVWGGHAVRPGDQVYELKQVTFAGDLLRVVLFLEPSLVAIPVSPCYTARPLFGTDG